MQTDPPNPDNPNKSVDIILPQDKAYSITLNGAPVNWSAAGGLNIADDNVVVLKLDPSVKQLLAPLAKEIGQDLFRLLTAQSASENTSKEYHKIISGYADFSEGFKHWARRAASSGWGKFSLLEFDPDSTHALIQVDSPWELVAQRSLSPEERWGCPFLFGKMLGMFKEALGSNCWANDSYSYLPDGGCQAIIQIFPSQKTIEDQLEKLRKRNLTKHELMLAREIEKKKAELRKSYSMLENIANLDFLTNLNNRRAFEEKLLNIKSNNTWSEYTILFVDLDQFKVINDTCGHIAGDKLLTQVSAHLIDCTQQSESLVARYDADTFLLLLRDSTDVALVTSENIRGSIQSMRFEWSKKFYQITCSIGLVPLNTIEPKVKNAIIAADNACHQAKKNGGDQVYISKSLNEFVENRLMEMNWIHKINYALNEDKFCLQYQLIKPLDEESETFGLEALLRMRDHDDKLIPPALFLPAAERYNAIYKIDCWVINEAFRLLHQEQKHLNEIEFISINLSGDTLSNPNLKEYILSKFEKYKINPHKICFEITETHMAMNLERAKHLLKELRQHGCQVALDDFGAGMSSFGYLRELPIDKIKIDGGFVKNMDQDMVDYTFVESIANVAKSMNLQTVAEFVENAKVMELLTDITVDYAQGYHIGKPRFWHEIFPPPLQNH